MRPPGVSFRSGRLHLQRRLWNGFVDPGVRLDPPLSLILDEIANLPPWPGLPLVQSNGGGSDERELAVLAGLVGDGVGTEVGIARNITFLADASESGEAGTDDAVQPVGHESKSYSDEDGLSVWESGERFEGTIKAGRVLGTDFNGCDNEQDSKGNYGDALGDVTGHGQGDDGWVRTVALELDVVEEFLSDSLVDQVSANAGRGNPDNGEQGLTSRQGENRPAGVACRGS